jgi:glutathione S-transferase
VFRYFDAFDAIDDFGFWDGLPKVQRWRRVLATRPSVAEAVRPEYPDQLGRFLLARRSALSQRMALVGAAA